MHVTSKDGTQIAYERAGDGPPVVLVDGAFCSRAFGPMPKLAPVLASRYTAYWYDRRGRGDSGDTQPYATSRELEDLAAVVAIAGGGAPVFMYGISSGAVLAMRAVAAGVPVKRLAIYEPPLVIAGSPPPVPPDRAAEIIALARSGDRGGAVKTFMRMVGAPAFAIPIMRLVPGLWKKLTAVAHTLPYDFAVLGDTGATKPMPADVARAMAAITVPTIVGIGGKSPAYMRHTAETVARAITGAQLRTLPGQTHNLAAKALAPMLMEWFA